jgi:hypothetical protein
MKRRYDIWEKRPAADNYSAASGYLKLLFSDAKAKAIVRRLRASGTVQFQAKDLLRASQTHLLDKANPKVASNLKHIKKGQKLSPVLLVRGNGETGTTLIIADGHHRICASWYWNEDCPVSCCLASPS